MSENILDLRGLSCPVTTMRLRKAMKTLDSGSVMVVLTDDKDARVDFPAAIRLSGNSLVSFNEIAANDSPYQKYVIRKSA